MRETEVIVLTFAYVVAMLVGLTGNTVLIYIVWKKPEIRTLTSFMFLNMAVADLWVTLLVMPVSTAHIHTDGAWIHGMIGEVTCKCFYYAAFFSITGSILCLVVMAVDRFLAVLYPFRGVFWFRKPKVITPIVWISSMILMSITLVIFDLNDTTFVCEYNFTVIGKETQVLQGIFTYFILVNYIIPLTVMCILYAMIGYKLWIHQPPGNITANNQQEREINKRKVVRMLIIVVTVFALCWLPSQVYQLFIVITKWQINLPPIVMNICYWFGHANSAINPWLYIGLNKKFKTAFYSMLRRGRESGDENHPLKNMQSGKRDFQGRSDDTNKPKVNRGWSRSTTHATTC